MQKGLILPLNRITRNVLNQIIKTERDQQITKKYNDKMSYGKLSKQDLDTIRFLLVKQVSLGDIANVFGIATGTVESIKNGIHIARRKQYS